MSEEDLELLITLDDPVEAPEEDTFNHLGADGRARMSEGRGIRRTTNELLFPSICD